jgi:hypothetical protein
MDTHTLPSPTWLRAAAGLAGLAATGWLGYLALSQRPPAVATATAIPAAPALAACPLSPPGYLRGRLHGSDDLDIDWSGPALACAGNARPDNAGLRLFFAGHPGSDASRLVLVIGIDAPLARLAGHEHAARVTLIDEASSQFFHAGDGRCVARINAVAPLPGERFAYRVEGSLYCIGAIAAVSGDRSVTIGDLDFAGRLALDSP